MISFEKDTAIDIPVRFEDTAGAAVTGKVAGDITVKIANKDSADWETQTAATHYTLNELSEGDYTLTILSGVNDTYEHLRIKISEAAIVTKQYVVWVNKIGSPVALDGGAAEISGMLTKLADDNGGASYNAETDSLNTRSLTGYDDGAIWIDTINGATGTVTGINGTADNPVKTWAEALTISAATSITRFRIANSNSITMTGSVNRYVFIGNAWSLSLAGQSVSNSYIEGAYITSSLAASAGFNYFKDCEFDSTLSLTGFLMRNCLLRRTCNISLTMNSVSTNYYFDNCYSGDEGVNPPTITSATASGKVQVVMRNYRGEIKVSQWGNNGADVLQIDGAGKLTILNSAVPAINPIITIQGAIEIDDQVAGGFVAGGGVINQDARYDYSQVNSAADLALSDYDGPTNAEMNARTLTAASYATASAQTTLQADITLLLALRQNRLEFDIGNSKAYIWKSDGTAREYQADLTDAAGSTVSTATTGPINCSKWTAI